MTPDTPREPAAGIRLRPLVTALLAVALLGALDHTVVATSLATIAGDLGALDRIGWIVVGYTLAATVLLPVIGRLGDLLGPRRVFLTSLAIFLIASAICGAAGDMTALIIARVVQGMASAGLQLMSQTIIAHATTARQRPLFLGLVGAAFPVAILIGPLLGGLITDHWGWPWVFWINLPVGAVAFVLAAASVPRIPAVRRPGFDVAGAVTFTIALVALVLACGWMPAEPWPGAVPGAIAVAAVAGAGFVVAERRASDPIVSLALIRRRPVLLGTALSAVVGIGLLSVTAYLPTYVQYAYATTATVSGAVPIATVLGMLAANLLTGWLVARSGRYRLYPLFGTALGCAGLVAMALLPMGAPLWAPMVVMCLVGLGTGAFMNLVVALVQGAVPPSELGAVTATVNVVRQVGATTATAVIGGIVAAGFAALPADDSAASLGIRAEAAHAVFAPVFLALAAVYAAGVIAAVLLPHDRLGDDTVAASLQPEGAS